MVDKTSIIERISAVINYTRLTQRKFSEKINVPQTTISNLFSRGSQPSISLVNSISVTYPEINTKWLLTGEGEMLKDGNLENNVEVSPLEKNTRPRIPMNAAAGRLTNQLQGITLDDCEQIPVIGIFPQYDFTILVKGDSMAPRYESGDEVACKRINGSQFIQWGKVHVLDTTQGVILKRIYDAGDRIRCNSFNPDYLDFEIPKDEIYSINLVVGLLRM